MKSEDFDVIAFETLASVKEAKAIMYLLHTESINKPAWLTFSCKDEVHTSHGEVFAEELAPLALQVLTTFHILKMCCHSQATWNLGSVSLSGKAGEWWRDHE